MAIQTRQREGLSIPFDEKMNILDSVTRTPCTEVAKPRGRSKTTRVIMKKAGTQHPKDSCMAGTYCWSFRQIILEVVDRTWWMTAEQRGPDTRHQCGSCGCLDQPSSASWLPSDWTHPPLVVLALGTSECRALQTPSVYFPSSLPVGLLGPC